MAASYMHHKWDSVGKIMSYGDSVGKIMSYVIMECPLDCKETFRTKAVLRYHLKHNHTKIELEKFLKEQE